MAAVLDQGFSAREATLKAAAGDIGPPPFEMPVSTAQSIVTDAKHRGRIADRDDQLHDLVDEVLTVAKEGTTKLLGRAKAGTLTSRDITLGRRLTQMAAQAAYLNNALSRKPTPDPEPTPDQDQASRKSYVDCRVSARENHRRLLARQGLAWHKDQSVPVQEAEK